MNSAPMSNDCTHEFKSVFPGGTAQALWAFHDEKNAFKTLTPFPIIVQVHSDERPSLTEGIVEFTLWFGPIPVRWKARHEPGPVSSSFADRMISGPVEIWYHRHIFRDVPGGVELTDCLTIKHKPGIAGLLTRLAFDGLPLRFLFFYRHMVTRRSMKRYAAEAK